MSFSIADVILIVIVLIFAIGGFVLGLVQAIGALIGLAAGAWVAVYYYLPVADWLKPFVLGHEGVAKVVAFLAIFIIINRLVAFLFWLVDKAFRIVALIPFVKAINRFAGFILGVVEGVIVLGFAIFLIAKYLPNVNWLTSSLNASAVAHWLVWSVQYLTSLVF